MDVPPERVFEVLSDPGCYDDWVVGVTDIRGVDGRWPEPGARLHHSVGVGPLELDDHRALRRLKALAEGISPR